MIIYICGDYNDDDEADVILIDDGFFPYTCNYR